MGGWVGGWVDGWVGLSYLFRAGAEAPAGGEEKLDFERVADERTFVLGFPF